MSTRLFTSEVMTVSTSLSSTRAVRKYTAVSARVTPAAKITTNSTASREVDRRMRRRSAGLAGGGALMRRCRRAASFAQHVPRTAHGVDQGVREALVDGIAQPAHVHVGDV